MNKSRMIHFLLQYALLNERNKKRKMKMMMA